MPAGLQVQNWFVAGIMGGGFVDALAPSGPATATFFNVPQGTNAFLGEIWAIDNASPCEISLTASRFHDQVLGIRLAVPDGSAAPTSGRATNVSPAGVRQRIFPSDVLTITASGTAADDVNVTLVVYYPDIPGIAGRFVTADAVRANSGNEVGIGATVTPAAGGGWGATVALNAADNRLHANRDYAVLGFTTQAPLSAVALNGIDTGNLDVGGPVLADGEHDAELFLDFSAKFQIPTVPIVNSNNAGNITLKAADPTVVAGTPITVRMVEFGGTV